MIYLEVPTDVVFFDQEQLRKRHIRMYNDVTLELVDGMVDRVVATNPREYMKYHNLIGTNKIDL